MQAHDECAPPPEHNDRPHHWVVKVGDSHAQLWTWQATYRSWHWPDLKYDELDGYTGEGLETGAKHAYSAGWRYVCPVDEPSIIIAAHDPSRGDSEPTKDFPTDFRHGKVREVIKDIRDGHILGGGIKGLQDAIADRAKATAPTKEQEVFGRIGIAPKK